MRLLDDAESGKPRNDFASRRPTSSRMPPAPAGAISNSMSASGSQSCIHGPVRRPSGSGELVSTAQRHEAASDAQASPHSPEETKGATTPHELHRLLDRGALRLRRGDAR